MLRDFGLVTVADLAVALLGVMLVLPAALVWAEEGFPLPGAPERARATATRASRPGAREPRSATYGCGRAGSHLRASPRAARPPRSTR